METINQKSNEFIPVAEPLIGERELEYVSNAVKSGWISSRGEYIQEFENKFAEFCGVRYGVSVMNGTCALHLALASLGIGKGDEVIVPTLTFVATANAVVYTGAKPVFVDSHPDYWCINPEKIEEKITKRTKAIIPVHLYGHPADMDAIMEIAKRDNLYVIEDAAEAHGAEYKGKKVGSIGDIGCFSFYGNKIITTGEGGMIISNDREFVEKAKLLRNQGMSKERKYWHPMVGYNYRMTNIQAAIGLAQLEKIDEMIQIKRRNAELYNSLLRDIPGITLPPAAKWAKSVYWMYCILIKDNFRMNRDKLMLKLREKKIDSRPFFYPIHTMPPYRLDNELPVAEELSMSGISLPSGVTLKKEQIERITGIIRESSLARW